MVLAAAMSFRVGGQLGHGPAGAHISPAMCARAPAARLCCAQSPRPPACLPPRSALSAPAGHWALLVFAVRPLDTLCWLALSTPLRLRTRSPPASVGWVAQLPSHARHLPLLHAFLSPTLHAPCRRACSRRSTTASRRCGTSSPLPTPPLSCLLRPRGRRARAAGVAGLLVTPFPTPPPPAALAPPPPRSPPACPPPPFLFLLPFALNRSRFHLLTGCVCRERCALGTGASAPPPPPPRPRAL
jgi:hypothetical protein